MAGVKHDEMKEIELHEDGNSSENDLTNEHSNNNNNNNNNSSNSNNNNSQENEAAMKVEIEPLEVRLNLSHSTEPSQTLKIKNPNDVPIAFKVKTTMQKRYRVKPNAFMLRPKETIELQVEIAKSQRDMLLDEEGPDKITKDRFLFTSTKITEPQYDSLLSTSKNNPKALNAILKELFGKKSKSQLYNIRLPSIIFHSDAAVAAQRQQSNGSLDNEAFHSFRDSGNPSYQGDSSGNEEASPGTTKTATADKTTRSNTDWQAKYRELLPLLVQVTDERDRYKNYFAEARKDIMNLELQLKEAGIEASDSSSKKNSEYGAEDENDDDIINSLPAKPAAEYHLWHLLLVAVVSFLLTRLLMADLE